VLIPIIVTPTGNDRYRLVAGERRVHAARLADHHDVPAVIRDVDEQTAGVWQAVENLHRRDLTASEEAAACARLLGGGMTRKQLAANLGRPASWVKARLALAGLPAAVQAAVDRGDLDPSDAIVLAPHAGDADLLEALVTENVGRDLDWWLNRYLARRDTKARTAAQLAALTDAGITPVERDQLPKRARNLHDLKLTERAHRGEPCHAVTVGTDWAGTATITSWCTDPKRHRPTGDSDIDSAALQAEDDRKAVERETARRDRDARQHRDDFARQAINARLRSRDLTEFVLPVLLEHLGMTELDAAAKLFGDIEPAIGHGHKDYATPMREWARQTPANTTRTLLAVAYVLGREATRTNWGSTELRQAWQTWLDTLGYQPIN
jgi:ParB family chromosome partitioning protein